MLTDAQRDIIKATVPLLESGGEQLIQHFYRQMLTDYPEVRPLFNQAHQVSGSQSRALAHAVLMYARHIDRLETLGPLVSQIVAKHVALQVQAEHYPIVGTCLIQAIRDVLGPEVATDAVLSAWTEAYEQLAGLLIGAESRVYDTIAAAPGGWRGGRRFRIAARVDESDEITSFLLEPEDGEAVVDFLPGQYIGLRLTIDGVEVRRNYSLSAAPNGRQYRISVKRQPDGLVSGYLHDRADEGAVLELFPPAGAFTLSEGERPLVLISGGVGITPTLAMAEAALADTSRTIHFIHYARNSRVLGFGDRLESWAREQPRFRLHLVLEAVEADAQRQPDDLGRPRREHFERWLPADRDVDAYLLGPAPFMAFVRRALVEVGVPADQIRHEFFGPAQALD